MPKVNALILLFFSSAAADLCLDVTEHEIKITIGSEPITHQSTQPLRHEEAKAKLRKKAGKLIITVPYNK